VLIPRRNLCVLWIVTAGALLVLSGCGASAPTSSGNFGGTGGTGSTSAEALASVTANPAQITGGAPAAITVNLTEPAPSGGISVQLTSSDTSAVTVPATISIPAGESSGTASASTSPVSASTSVAITALYQSSVAGTSLSVAPAAAKGTFTIAVAPATVSIAPGKSGSSKITTKITTGYSHALTLSVSNLPEGVTATLTPKTIPLPGSGTSTVTINVASTAATGTYSLKATATDGKTSANATLTLKVTSADAGATFLGCWYQQNGNRYQGVQVSVATPGTYAFDADLYNGTTCNANDQADEFGFGQEIKFGGFDYIFWFTDFKNQSNMSALWHVGKDTSACVNYEVAPDCP
jgi:hypothetical protein